MHSCFCILSILVLLELGHDINVLSLAWTTEKFTVGSALRTVLWGDQRLCRITIPLMIFNGGVCGPAWIWKSWVPALPVTLFP